MKKARRIGFALPVLALFTSGCINSLAYDVDLNATITQGSTPLANQQAVLEFTFDHETSERASLQLDSQVKAHIRQLVTAPEFIDHEALAMTKHFDVYATSDGKRGPCTFGYELGTRPLGVRLKETLESTFDSWRKLIPKPIRPKMLAPYDSRSGEHFQMSVVKLDVQIQCDLSKGISCSDPSIDLGRMILEVKAAEAYFNETSRDGASSIRDAKAWVDATYDKPYDVATVPFKSFRAN